MGKYAFSVIMAIYNSEEYLEDAISSLVGQSLDFESNVQLILVDDASVDASKDICLRYQDKYPKNILFLSKEHEGQSAARNLGLKHAEGDYISFLDSDDKLSPNALSEVLAAFNKYDVDVVNISIELFERNSNYVTGQIKSGIVDLTKNPDMYLTSSTSSFFKRQSLQGIEFETSLPIAEESLFVNKAILKSNRYAYIDSARYLYRKRMDKSSIRDNARYNPDFYVKTPRYSFRQLIDYSRTLYYEVPEYIQTFILKSIYPIVTSQWANENLAQEELNSIFSEIQYAVNFMDTDMIRKSTTNLSVSSFLIAIKNGDLTLDNIASNSKPELEAKLKSDNVIICSGEDEIDSLNDRFIYLDFVDLKNDLLKISGYFKSICEIDRLSIYLVKQSGNDVEIIESTSFAYPNRYITRFLGMDWEKIYNFDIKVPLEELKRNYTLKIQLKYDDCLLKSEIRFRKYCNISYDSHYYVKENRIVMFNGVFNVMPYSYAKMIRYEARGQLKLARDRHRNSTKAMILRLFYLFLYPVMRHFPIWIIMDRIDLADDNGEHFFKYALKQDDGIRKYFAIQKSSPDYERLKKTYDNVLDFNSKKFKLIYIFADKLISSQGSEFYLNPYRHTGFYLTAGCTYLDFYFLQHGIILHDLSSWLVKYDRNPKIIVTSCIMEYESLTGELYNYDDNVFRLLGLPRYDNLNNKGYKKQIAIMPTWRKFIKNENDLVESEYFQKFNSFLNNERLIAHARKKGYEILFKPHPELARYLHCFDRNDYVQIDNVKKYQEVFNESAILITDYSSIFFDFAYLKKPIIYYHYGNDFHYDSEDNYFDYETMGFGKIAVEEDDLIDTIISYMDNDAKMEDMYKDRVDSFFKFNDTANTKRCYDAIHDD